MAWTNHYFLKASISLISKMAHSKYYLFLLLHGNNLLKNYQLPDFIVLWQAVCIPSLERGLEESGVKASVPMAN